MQSFAKFWAQETHADGFCVGIWRWAERESPHHRTSARAPSRIERRRCCADSENRYNPYNVSEIETIANEAYFRKQAKLRDTLDQTLPEGHSRHMYAGLYVVGKSS